VNVAVLYLDWTSFSIDFDFGFDSMNGYVADCDYSMLFVRFHDRVATILTAN
jgi:hypothetical protein